MSNMKTNLNLLKQKHYWILAIMLLFSYFGHSQLQPSKKGFESYKIELANDTIDFYIYNPKKLNKKHLFVFVTGSMPAPLWIETNPCCVSLDIFNYNLIPEDYAYLVISKYGFSFSEKENFDVPKNFWKKNTLDFRVKRTNKVIEYIKKNIFKPEKVVVVGHSQGTDVAAKLATVNKDITHLVFLAGGGLSQLMEFIMFIRKDAIAGKISEEVATQKINSLLLQFEKMFADPSPKKMWDENSYLSYVSYSEPPVKSLLKLEIPIYVAVGTKDTNVAVENSYIIPVEFIRHRKKNLTFRQFPNYDHGFVEIKDGKEIDKFDEVTKDFLKWIK